MISPKRIVSMSKGLSWILRHEAERLGLVLDPEGFAAVTDVIHMLAEHAGIRTSTEEIREVVELGDPAKQRFSIVDESIRANYGHSLTAVVMQVPAHPPAILLHGTSREALPVIRSGGLRPMKRQYVHLTTNETLALSVGRRHGPAHLVRVDAARAYADGIVFFIANPSFWLAHHVPSQYLLDV